MVVSADPIKGDTSTEAAEQDRLQQRERRGSFADFLRESALCGSNLEVTRLPGGLRDLDLSADLS
jgi:hypothetical protein